MIAKVLEIAFWCLVIVWFLFGTAFAVRDNRSTHEQLDRIERTLCCVCHRPDSGSVVYGSGPVVGSVRVSGGKER